MTKTISLTVNGKPYSGEAEPRTLLAHFLRDSLRLTGTHLGCVVGRCGACTVMWNGTAVKSCMVFAVQADGDEIVTVEGQFSTGTQRFAIGSRVPMLYRLEKPNEARVALFVDNWLGPCIAALVGLVGLAGGFLVRRSVRRELAKPGA